MFRLALDQGLHLEKVETRHADALFAMVDAHRAELDRWTALPPGVPPGLDGFRRWIGHLRDDDAADRGVTCGIWRGDEPVGMVALGEISAEHLSAVIWGFIAPGRHRRGEGTLASRAMVDYGFRALGLERVEWRCVAENEPSRRLAERLGFEYEARLRHGVVVGDAFRDLIVHGMVAGEWAAACDRVERVRVRPAGADAWEVEGQGTIAVRIDGHTAEIVRLAVEPAARGRQVGRRLVEVALAELRHRGVALVFTRVAARAPAHRRKFLERRGFRPLEGGLWARSIA
jgi:ribosomal-protein-serine acetyltransferase